VVHALAHDSQKGLQRTSPKTWYTGDDGGETRVWLELMERKISDFGKANFQAYTDPAGEVMEETIHGRGRHRGEVG
jgi:hypothetical protein